MVVERSVLTEINEDVMLCYVMCLLTMSPTQTEFLFFRNSSLLLDLRKYLHMLLCKSYAYVIIELRPVKLVGVTLNLPIIRILELIAKCLCNVFLIIVGFKLYHSILLFMSINYCQSKVGVLNLTDNDT